jgi:hypothetical protein
MTYSIASSAPRSVLDTPSLIIGAIAYSMLTTWLALLDLL